MSCRPPLVQFSVRDGYLRSPDQIDQPFLAVAAAAGRRLLHSVYAVAGDDDGFGIPR